MDSEGFVFGGGFGLKYRKKTSVAEPTTKRRAKMRTETLMLSRAPCRSQFPEGIGELYLRRYKKDTPGEVQCIEPANTMMINE